MITCNLGDKKYTVDYISGRALREIGPAMDMYTKIVQFSSNAVNSMAVDEKGKIKTENVVEQPFTLDEALDELVVWFCILFGNQFSVEEVYDKYPVDNLVHDIAFALMAVQSQVTSVLAEFPMKATKAEADPQKKSRTTAKKNG